MSSFTRTLNQFIESTLDLNPKQDTRRSSQNRMIKLPFSLNIDRPFSKVVYKDGQNAPKTKGNQLTAQRDKKWLVLTMNSIVEQKIKIVFFQLRKHASLKIHSSTVCKIYTPNYTNKHTKNQFRVQLLNQRVLHSKKQAFYRMKDAYLSVKRYQLISGVESKQEKLLVYLSSKIQERLKKYAFRKIFNQFKHSSGQHNLVNALQKTVNVYVARCLYSQFFLKVRLQKTRKDREEVIFSKLALIVSRGQHYFVELAFRKICNLVRWKNVENIIAEKKKLISKIYDLNSERTTTLQLQRQKLRALKYKLDHEAVEKSHVLTEKRREQILAKSRFNEESKQLALETAVLETELNRLRDIRRKEKWLNCSYDMVGKSVRQAVQYHTQVNSTAGGKFYEGLVKRLYSTLDNLLDSNSDTTIEQVEELIKLTESRVFQGQEGRKSQNILSMESFPADSLSKEMFEIDQTRFFQLVIRQHESRKLKSVKGLSKMHSPVAMMKMSKSYKSLNSSQSRSRISPVVHSPSRNRAEAAEIMKVKEETCLQRELIEIILRQQYQEFKIKQQQEKAKMMDQKSEAEEMELIQQMSDI